MIIGNIMIIVHRHKCDYNCHAYDDIVDCIKCASDSVDSPTISVIMIMMIKITLMIMSR